MVQLILTIWLLLIVVLSFIKIKWGLTAFIMYFILIPGFNIGIPGLGSGQNVIMLLILLAYFFQSIKLHFKTDLYFFSPFIAFAISKLIVIPFQEMPISENIDYFRKWLIDSLTIPLIIFNVIKNDRSSLVLFRNTIILCITITIAYGLYLTTTGGINPYTTYMAQILNTWKDFYEEYYSAEGTGRIFGRISSVFQHPMTFAMFLGGSIVYLIFLLSIKKNTILLITLLSAIILSLICGVRSVLGGLIVAVVLYLIVTKKVKILIYCALTISVFYYVISILSTDFFVYLQSITTTSSDIKGSSMESRYIQLEGAIDIMKKNPIFGMGADWVSYYLDTHGNHPVCLAFESLIFVVLCNSGIFGCFVWCYIILKYIYINKKKKVLNYNIINMLLFFYISYSCITGEYGYMKYFLLFYSLMLGESYYNKNILLLKK